MTDNTSKERQGVHLVGLGAARLGLIFRDQPPPDIGIDAQIETKAPNKGRLIAVQIKAGPSWFELETDTGWWHPISGSHHDLWINGSLPVIVILCDLETEKCYWVHVTKDACVDSGKNWKILVPKRNLFDQNHLPKLIEIASPVAAASDYTICSEKDVSSGVAKRISLDIVAHNQAKALNKPLLGAIVRDALEIGKQSAYARNQQSKNAHDGKTEDVVWGFVYLRDIDRAAAAWVCRFQWVSQDLDQNFRPLLISGESIGEGLVIDWNIQNNIAAHMDSRRETKATFLDRFDKQYLKAPAILRVLTCINDAGGIDHTTQNFPELAQSFERAWDDRYAAPQECQRLSQGMQEMLGTIGAVGLIWSQLQTRTIMQTLSLSRSYQGDLERLISDLEFLRRDVI